MGKKKEKKRQLNEAANNSPKKKRLEELQLPQIDDDYKDVEKWKEILQSGLKDIKPFPHWQLKNFIKNSENVVEEIEDELQNFDGWHRKENDLYSLWQTDDFKALEADQTPSLCKFREFFYGPVKKWLQEVSGVELLDQVDMNGSLYSHTDNLLPHNDLIDTRRFAFVYYLVPFMWEETNGGELCLYNSDENDQPTDIAVELKPHRNSLLIFEVTHKSWHRVKEILTREDPRLSINGWFHSSRRLEAKSAPPAEISRFSQIDGEGDLSSWIDKRYLTDKSVKGQLAETFSDTSEIQLKNFFTDRGRKLLEELKRLDFQERGPPNKRHSRCGDLQSGGAEFQGLNRLLKSKPMATFLSEITGCELNECHVSLSLSRLQTGSYTVLGDEDHELADKDGFILETHLFWADQEWPEKSGGDTVYVSKGDEEPLITIHPDPFSANIVLREPEVLPFLKYTNSLAQGSFYQVTLTYYNVPIERENEDEEEEQEENEEIEE